MDTELQTNLSRFKRCRDALLLSDTTEFLHHLRDFCREIRANPLTRSIVNTLPKFDTAEWWRAQATEHGRPRGRARSLEFPPGESDRLAALLDLAESIAKNENDHLSVDDLGIYFGTHKSSESTAIAANVVCHPLAEMLSDRLREQVQVANPAVRELAGVPLNRIPNDNEVRIFLSHKSLDKPLVTPFHNLLTELGFEPWLDVEDMKAGDTLHREIDAGFDGACAVVFFVTRYFTDERWLRHEVDQAVRRKVERGDRFAIITLVFDGAPVPRSLQNYLFITVENPLQAVRQLVRALPISLGPPRWRT